MNPVTIDASLELRPIPAIVSLAVFASAALSAMHAVFSEELAATSALAIAAGSVVLGVVAVVGLLVTRGAWTRRLGIVIAAGALAGSAWIGFDAWGVATLVAAGVAILGSTGPWLTTWIRRARPLGPGPVVVVATLGALAVPIAVGAASPSGLTGSDAVVAVAAPAAAWAYSAGHLAGLWTLRMLVPALAVTAWALEPTLGRATVVIAIVALAGLFWHRTAFLAVRPLLDELQGPRRASPQAPSP